MAIHRISRALLGLALATCFATCDAGPFVDVLDTPAQMSPLATKHLLQGVTRAGERLVAVGQRGHIVLSDDDGATWRQARVPVSSDLTAVCFVDAKLGWVVGNDGVVLHTEDGGETWRLQLDGRKGNELLVATMQRNSDADPNSERAKKLLAEALRYREQGPDMPLLDVWFADARNGFVVGAYNLIYRTTDGGASWTPWFDRTDNPKFLNLYAIRNVAGELYVAGESGLLLKLDRDAQRFRALDLPYKGSLFGIAAAKSAVLVFGLRGNVFRSEDAGKTWTKVDAGLPAAIVAATRVSSNATLIADAGGRIASTDDGGRSFARITVKPAMPVTGLTEGARGRLVLVGPRGVVATAIEGR